jgi:uncharacterized membrane protein YjjP (DUF1212 family)
VLSTVSLIGDPTTGNLRLQRIGGSYRFDQIAAVEDQLTRARTASAPPEEITAALKTIDSARAPLPVWLRVAGYGLATVGFAAALRLDPSLFLVALGLGLLVGVALALVNPNSRGGALMPIAATFGVALIVGILSDAAGLDDPVRLAAVPVLFLLPGATITSAVIELVNGDMLAGSSRLVFAIMQLVAMAFAFVLAIDLAGVSPQDLRDLSPTEGPAWLAWLGAGAFAAGLAIYGCTPRRLWAKILVLAFFAFTVQQLASEWLAGPLAGGVAAALALLGAYILDSVGEDRGRQRTQSGPAALVLFIPAFWLIVPGSLGFTALAGALAANQSLSALGPQAAFTFLTMAIGIMLASLVWTRWTDPGTG